MLRACTCRCSEGQTERQYDESRRVDWVLTDEPEGTTDIPVLKLDESFTMK
jgi:hypothetical protein